MRTQERPDRDGRDAQAADHTVAIPDDEAKPGRAISAAIDRCVAQLQTATDEDQRRAWRSVLEDLVTADDQAEHLALVEADTSTLFDAVEAISARLRRLETSSASTAHVELVFDLPIDLGGTAVKR